MVMRTFVQYTGSSSLLKGCIDLKHNQTVPSVCFIHYSINVHLSALNHSKRK